MRLQFQSSFEQPKFDIVATSTADLICFFLDPHYRLAIVQAFVVYWTPVFAKGDHVLNAAVAIVAARLGSMLRLSGRMSGARQARRSSGLHNGGAPLNSSCAHS
jgi:hypothetical protein